MKKFFELRVILQPKEGALLPLVSPRPDQDTDQAEKVFAIATYSDEISTYFQ